VSAITQVESQSQNQSEAEYTLEAAVCCPHCKATVETVQVVRLLRTKVNFTSSLPRRGYVVICPACRAVVPAAVGGLLT
jgi:hypothetical protein